MERTSSYRRDMAPGELRFSPGGQDWAVGLGRGKLRVFPDSLFLSFQAFLLRGYGLSWSPPPQREGE
jgi:hypothetical protein